MRGPVAELDAWMSAGLGRPAFRVRLADGQAADGLPAALTEGPFFATAKVAIDAVADAARLQDLGFRVVDTGLHFASAAAALSRTAPANSVRMARAEDRPHVEAIARAAFATSRFHLDPAFPKSLAAGIKAAWAGNFFAGKRGDVLLVSPADGVPQGFLLALRGGGGWIVDLIAVAATAKGRGIGRDLMTALAATPIAGYAPDSVRAGTQAANGAALAFYARLNMAIESAGYVLHHHGKPAPYPSEFKT
jgi:ribosomal protein S18 acetylase RimI-like enzyme